MANFRFAQYDDTHYNLHRLSAVKVVNDNDTYLIAYFVGVADPVVVRKGSTHAYQFIGELHQQSGVDLLRLVR
ncbi:hypothetical protein [Flaviaesturariibacter amylovorans]|uniref:Uncharacterized protein n=1 Tax=Flaviaesturariibacter amylovorans TaxID=1084520 RepID=A0ABP8GKM9_9BACT